MTHNTIDYGEKEYWDQRYESDIIRRPHFDWYHGYKTLAPFLNRYLDKHDRIMMLGCGNSKLGEDMNDDGYSDIVNIDFSNVIIDDMKQRTQGRVGIEYITMDGRKMEYQDESFDAIFDKGTIDAVMCSDDDNQNAIKMVSEVARVLKPGAVFIVMTYGSPESRLPLFKCESYNWTVTPRMLGTHIDAQSNECHYAYIMKKNRPSDDQQERVEKEVELFQVYLNSSIGKIPLIVIPIVKE